MTHKYEKADLKMVWRAGQELYIIPTLSIIESLRPTIDQIEKML